uniref:C-type lectin domain-containing protein n=1 Tax=Castor canadensis TaxID=51338 RepID=A0A8C0X7Z1_CASCN
FPKFQSRQQSCNSGLFYSRLILCDGLLNVEYLHLFWDCCPTLWRPFQSSCYFISTELLSWAESRNSCLAMGADLVVITTKNEQDFIIQNLNIDSDYYVGLLDPEGQNHWQWVDQTPYNQSATFWHTKEPNMLDERCVAVNFRKEESRHWGWNDVHCHIPLKSVCETKICL